MMLQRPKNYWQCRDKIRDTATRLNFQVFSYYYRHWDVKYIYEFAGKHHLTLGAVKTLHQELCPHINQGDNSS